MACIYSVPENKAKAIEYLKKINPRNNGSLWLLNLLKHSPLLDNIRSEPEFAYVLEDAETKFQKQHEQVGELLREYGEID